MSPKAVLLAVCCLPLLLAACGSHGAAPATSTPATTAAATTTRAASPAAKVKAKAHARKPAAHATVSAADAKVAPYHREQAVCEGLPVARDVVDCRASYQACSAGAAKTVRAYYNGGGATLDGYATRYAKDTYGPGPAWQEAMAGCLGALMAEYDRLYG